MFDAKKHGPWAIIAGGSEGIGECLAERLGRAGINLVLIARKPEPLEALAKRVREEIGVEVRALAMDLTRPDMLERIREITDDVEVGLVIYNAGDAAGIVHFLDRTLDNALHTVKLNVIGPTNLAYHFGGKMRARGHGGIILIGSLAGNAGIANIATYCASKAYQQLLAEALWAELTPQGVDVLSFVVGSTDTPARTRANTTEGEDMVTISADVVAAEALEFLGDGPVQTPRAVKPLFEGMAIPNRRAIVEAAGQTVRPKG